MEEENTPQPPLAEQSVTQPTPEPHPEPVYSESSEPVEGPQEPKTDYLKIGLLVLAGFVLLSAACAGYWYASKQQDAQLYPESAKGPTPTPQPTPTPSVEERTKDWESYTNTEYRYLIKYPRDWIFEEVDLSKSKGGTIHAIRIFPLENLGLVGIGLSLEDIHNWEYRVVEEMEKVIINEIDGFKGEPHKGTPETVSLSDIFLKGDKYLYHLGLYSQEGKETLNEKVDLMLQTFQLTD